MTAEELRESLERWWIETDAEALAHKESQAATLSLVALYGDLSPSERVLADEVVTSWTQSENNRKRFDALAVISHFGIRTAIPHLLALKASLSAQRGPEARFEVEKVERILAELGDAG